MLCFLYPLLFFLNYFYFRCTGVLTTCMSVHHVCVYSAQGPKEGMGSTETRLTDGCKLPCECWGQTWATESSLQLPLHSVKTGFRISLDWLPNQHPAFPSLCRSTLSVPFLSQPCLSYCQNSGFHSLRNGEPAGSSVLPKWAPWFCNSGCVIYCEECSFLCLC